MKNRTKGILMYFILFTVVVFGLGYLLDNYYIPAFIFLVSVFIAFYILKANELLTSDD